MAAAAAAALPCPVHVRRADVMTPPKSAPPLAAAIPHAHTITLASGHALMTEQPDAVNEALQAFIGSR
jgi:pimeloyl-ACP methyl ester carboxylesterase